MKVHTLDKAELINEVQFGSNLNHAMEAGRRADFALMMSLLSNDLRENTPVEKINEKTLTENLLRQRFQLADAQILRSNEESYSRSASQANQFHNGGLASAKLQHGLAPDAMAYMPQDTCDLPEDVYHNLSGHQRRQLESGNEIFNAIPQDLYNELVTAKRHSEMNLYV
ncbi:VC2046/SO_2500 family protein [Aliivibrio wodanis]|uniref:Ribosomal S4P (Gammaproteobacterial) n=1 Tax=Aliivibrio wodanis TaxID=80852 RepID=A0A090IK31_9GAMM|nr:putative uncharacterized protein [Aliivibrio wodanis]VVV03571.1 hypothetical protein AW0309160_00953 [Aliivibrio wodanis]